MPTVTAPLVGTYALGVSVVLVLVLVVGLATRSLYRAWAAVASGAALVGGAIAVLSAASAIVDVGITPPYDTHVVFGWAALTLGGLAAATGAIPLKRPIAAASVMALAGALGCVAISLFFVNTWYLTAMPLWLAAAVLRASGAASGTRGTH